MASVTKRLPIVLFTVLLVVFSIGPIYAGGGVFTLAASSGTSGGINVTGTPTTPFDWIEFLRNIIGLGGLVGFLRWLGRTIRKFWEKRKWNRKYGKSRTPVVMKEIGN